MTDPMAETNAQNVSVEPKKRAANKRIARACDHCRLRKTKCDGFLPCETCRLSERHCTYHHPTGRIRNSAARTQILEERLRRARAYLAEAQEQAPSIANVNFDTLLGVTSNLNTSTVKDTPDLETDSDDDDGSDKLESMMDSYGQMTMSASNGVEREFYGASSGLAWIQATQAYFNYFEDGNSGPSFDNGPDSSATVQLFDAPLPPRNDLEASQSQLLPPKDTALRLVKIIFTQVYPMFNFLSDEDFEASIDRIYLRAPIDYQDRDQQFLPLFYLILGLGYLFSKVEHDKHGCRKAINQAMRHFTTVREKMDISRLRTIESLQSVIALILFLISTARIASAHAFLGSACAAALRQGLHFRSTYEAEISYRERKVRRRVFWALINLDMYISLILGLPPCMDLNAVDPAINLTIYTSLKEARSENGLTSYNGLALAAAAKHIDLMRIAFRARQTLFPKPSDLPESNKRHGSIIVSIRKLKAAEKEFQEWAQSLAEILSYPGNDIEVQSIKYEIQIFYYFTQVVLYRAFLHYLLKLREDGSVTHKHLSYANTCVRMAARVIEVSTEHQRRGLLCPASWPSIYTVFISIICLIYALAAQSLQVESNTIHRDVEDGIRLLACTACSTDTGSVRCLEVLRRLLENAPSHINIDINQICTDTKPCCTTVFQSRSQLPTSTPDGLRMIPKLLSLNTPRSSSGLTQETYVDEMLDTASLVHVYQSQSGRSSTHSGSVGEDMQSRTTTRVDHSVGEAS